MQFLTGLSPQPEATLLPVVQAVCIVTAAPLRCEQSSVTRHATGSVTVVSVDKSESAAAVRRHSNALP